MLVGGLLAGWGFSTPARSGKGWLMALFDSPSSAVLLISFYTIPEFRGRKLYQALLAHILMQRFSEGAARAYIFVKQRNQPSLRAILRVGFRLVARHANPRGCGQ